MRFGELEIDPARNPAVLDTATWAPGAAWDAVRAVDAGYWRATEEAARLGAPLPSIQGLTTYPGSCAGHGGSVYFLAGLADGQRAFIELGTGGGESVLGRPVGVQSLAEGRRLAMYPTDAAVIDRFCRLVHPAKGPRALGPVPRLGIGTRMTRAVWPAIWRAMDTGGFAANAIQNSVRELYLLDDLLAGRPAESSYAFSFGTIESGHTGSTFEGLWVSGVLAALASDTYPRYGADADHIQVRRGPGVLQRARRVIDAARYYSFFTLDVSDILDYAALFASPTEAAERTASLIPDPLQRRALIAYHRQRRRIGGRECVLDETATHRLIGKYWHALSALEELAGHIAGVRESAPFDLELSIDEHPPEVATFDCVTTDAELAFVLLEVERRQIPLTHVAPNLGIEKGTDYRCPDGLPGLERRAQSLSRIAADLGLMLDVHSGDDLSPATWRAIRRATQGRVHLKVSPSLQLLFARVLEAHHPDLLRQWWDDAVDYARREASSGSAFAAECLRAYEVAGDRQPSAQHAVFHHYGFAFVGRRDAAGRFLHRQALYDLSPAFVQAYEEQAAAFLVTLAEELFGAGSVG